MNGFVLKKFISAWLMPLPFIVLLLSVACICLWCRRERIARWVLTIALALLIFSSCRAFTNFLVLPLENHYPALTEKFDDVEMVVVMGASQSDGARLPLTNRLNTSSMYRLLEGVAVYRRHPGAKLLLSGGGEYESNGELMARVAAAIDVPSQDILIQNQSRDTEQEVKLLAPMVRGHKFAVVTSAAHMVRTMALFEREGLHPLPAPTDFLDRDNPHLYWRDYFLPNVDSMGRAQFAMHEYVGLLWLQVKGEVQ